MTTLKVFLVSLLLLIFSENCTADADFTCPTDTIFRQSGVFPKNVLTLTTFPSNYDCEFKFQIEDGFVYKLTLEANATNGSGDSLIVTDSLGKQMTYTDGIALYFAPSNFASIKIKSSPGTSQFWFRYEYTFVGQLEQTKLPTGKHLNLNVTPQRIYTFISPYNDNVVINTGMVDDINTVDPSMKAIYVYDGPDIYSKFVGNLYDYVTSEILSKSSGNATTLANFYGTGVFSYALANDYKSITSYDTYNFIVYTKSVTIPKNFQDGISNAYTFYSTMYDTVYLTDLDIGPNGMKVDFRALTPSDGPKFFLEYNYFGPYKRSLPQIIPGRKFTMVTLGPEMTFTLSATADNWLTPYNGRRGVVFSPSLWNPGASSRFNYTFESTTLMTFKFNFDSAIIHQAGEQVQCKVGRPGATPVSVTFSSSVTNPGVRVANGTYLTTSYLGDNPSSSAIISFEMFDADGTPWTTDAPQSTTAHVETTTKFGSRSSFGFVSVLVVLVMKLL